MGNIDTYRSENVDEHIEKMDSNIGGNAAGLLLATFPRCMVPTAT